MNTTTGTTEPTAPTTSDSEPAEAVQPEPAIATDESASAVTTVTPTIAAATASKATAESESEREAGSDLPAKIAENLWPATLSGIIVVMFGYFLTATNDRITATNDRITATNDRITALEHNMNDRFAQQNKKIDDLEDKIDDLEDKINEINLKLTALIAALDKTDEVAAAVSGTFSSAAVHGTDENPDGHINAAADDVGGVSEAAAAITASDTTSAER